VPRLGVVVVADDFLRVKPHCDFSGGRIDRIGAMHYVSSDIDTQISAQGSRVRMEGERLPQDLATGGYYIVAFPDHAAERALGDVSDEFLEEGLGAKIRVVAFDQFYCRLSVFHGDKLKSPSLELGNDEADL